MHTPAEWLSTEEIAPPLRRLAGEDAHVCGDWSAERFRFGQGDGLGVWRVAGTMVTSGGERPWSLAFKGWDNREEHGAPFAFNWPLREAELYESGVLTDLPAVCAPAYFGSMRRGDSIWVWLEDLTHLPQPEWTPERYAQAARHLGQFNGAYLTGRKLPVNRSLSQQWLSGWTAAGEETMATLDPYLQHPVVRKIFPPEVLDVFLRIWDRRQDTLDTLHAMPQTFCHLDAFHHNIFFRQSADDEEIVLVDWSYSGIAALGEELGALCIAGITFDPRLPDNLDEVEEVAFASYIAGLRDAGWHGSEEEVWRAYRSAGILRYGPASFFKAMPMYTSDEWRAGLESMGLTFDHVQDHLIRYSHWVAEHAEDV